MNPWQAFRQIQTTLRAAVWPGTAAVVFPSGSVLVSSAPSPEAFNSLRMPCILMRPGSLQADPEFNEEPDLLQQELGVTLAQIVAGDSVGENALMGANRQTSSAEGYGLLELEEHLLGAIGILDELEGLTIQCRTRSAVRSETRNEERYVIWRDYLFEMALTADKTYQDAGSLTASQAGGTITLVWTLPTERYDIDRAVLRRASGTTAPDSIISGTGITLASDLALTVDNAPGSGTWSYALFVVYDDGSVSPSRTITVVVA